VNGPEIAATVLAGVGVCVFTGVYWWLTHAQPYLPDDKWSAFCPSCGRTIFETDTRPDDIDLDQYSELISLHKAGCS
jgi:hypothetical protein